MLGAGPEPAGWRWAGDPGRALHLGQFQYLNVINHATENVLIITFAKSFVYISDDFFKLHLLTVKLFK